MKKLLVATLALSSLSTLANTYTCTFDEKVYLEISNNEKKMRVVTQDSDEKYRVDQAFSSVSSHYDSNDNLLGQNITYSSDAGRLVITIASNSEYKVNQFGTMLHANFSTADSEYLVGYCIKNQ